MQSGCTMSQMNVHLETEGKQQANNNVYEAQSHNMNGQDGSGQHSNNMNGHHVAGQQSPPDVILRKSPMRVSNGVQSGDEAEQNKTEDELVRRRSASVMEVTEHAHTRLREELLKAKEELKLKDEECKKLTHVQDQMSIELEDLTAKLFEEANKMVQEANIKRMAAEKHLDESNAKIEMLLAEVTALKTLVITSTPSMPNRHLHPQIDKKKTEFVKGHRRSTSHHNFTKEVKPIEVDLTDEPPMDEPKVDDNREVDPVYFDEFRSWRGYPTLDQTTPFLRHIISEEIIPCLSFTNTELSKFVFDCVIKNSLTIEPVAEKCPFPRKCALTETTRSCKYRIKLADEEPHHFISQLVRNRIAAVCDFVTYIRYITQGLVKTPENEMYWELIRLRRQMCVARLGLS